MINTVRYPVLLTITTTNTKIHRAQHIASVVLYLMHNLEVQAMMKKNVDCKNSLLHPGLVQPC